MSHGLSRAPRRSRLAIVLALAAALTALPTITAEALSTDTNRGMMSGSSPSIAALSFGAWEAAYQGSNGHLFTYSSSGVATDTGQAMLSGTSPSITALTSGGWMIAYQASTTALCTYSSSGVITNSGLGMLSGTSPSIAGLTGGGWEAAFQANTTALWTYSTSGGATTNSGLGMLSGTSPSIAGLANGGWEVSFQANTGALWTYSNSGGVTSNTNQGMRSGTSPSIAGLPSGGWEIAFQANTGTLYTYDSSGVSTNRNQGMLSGTNPSIAALPSGGWEVAFQAINAVLFTYSSSAVSTSINQGMLSGTSPSVSGLFGGWDVAFQGSAGHLFTYTPPAVSSLSPQAGPTTGGTPVTVTGANFVPGDTTVSLGSVAATGIHVVSSTTLTFVTPPGIPEGQVQVTLTTTSGGTSTLGGPATTFQFTNSGPFHPITTSRICDTRTGTGTLCSGSGQDNYLAPLPSSAGSRDVQVAGVGGIPASGVAAVAMDLFIAPRSYGSSGSYGNVSVFPTGLAGGASNLSWVNGNFETLLIEIPVSPQVQVGGQWTGGKVTIQNSWSSSDSVDFIMDVQGYVSDSHTDASGLINSIAPASVCNTATSGDGCYVAGNAGLGAGASRTFTVLGKGQVPTSGVSAVVLNIQTYAEGSAGWLIVYPSDQPRPSVPASMLWNAWTPLTNHIIVPVDTVTGALTVFVGAGTTQVSMSVDGWFTDNSNPSATGGLYNPNNGTLVCDTMANTGTPCSTGTKLQAGTALPVQISDLAGVPEPGPNVTGVELSLTVTNVDLSGYPSGTGTYICVYASGSSCQDAELNLYGGVPANLLVIVPLGPDGQVDVYTPTGKMDVLIAVTGFYTNTLTVFNAPNGAQGEAFDFLYKTGIPADTRPAAYDTANLWRSPSMPQVRGITNGNGCSAMGDLPFDTFFAYYGHVVKQQSVRDPNKAEWYMLRFEDTNGHSSYVVPQIDDVAAAQQIGYTDVCYPQHMQANHSLAVIAGCMSGLTDDVDHDSLRDAFFNAGATVAVGFNCLLVDSPYSDEWARDFWGDWSRGLSVQASLSDAAAQVTAVHGSAGGYDSYAPIGDTTMTNAWR